MGVVYQVRHTGLGERFALKVLRPTDKIDPSTTERFHREARAAASLRCEHVVRVIDFGHLEDGSPFFVMELVEGANLATLLKHQGTLSIEEALRAALHACAALAEAHALGIVHRDIKPANLLLTTRSDGSPLIKLADFGIAKLLTAGSLTDTHTALGSPAYMAPEQIRDARVVDPRSDVWSLGVTLQELLCGQTPFHAFTAPGILSRVLTEDPTPLRALHRSLPEGLYAVVERCLNKDPSHRFSSILDLADALGAFAPEPGEAARVRRIAAFARRAPPSQEPPAQPPAVVGQITETSTSLTQAPGPPENIVPIPARTSPSPTRSSRRRIPPAAAIGLTLALLSPVALRALLRSRPAASTSPTAAPSSAASIPLAAPQAPATAQPSAALPVVMLEPAQPAPQGSPSASDATPPPPPRSSATPARPPPRPPVHDHPPQLGDFGSRQ